MRHDDMVFALEHLEKALEALRTVQPLAGAFATYSAACAARMEIAQAAGMLAASIKAPR